MFFADCLSIYYQNIERLQALNPPTVYFEREIGSDMCARYIAMHTCH